MMVDGPDENLNQDAAPPVCPTCGGAIPRETGQDGSSADGLPDWGSAVRGLGLAPESPPDVARGLDDGTNLVGRTAGDYSTFNEKPFISTHAQYNAAKRNELRGANPQVNFMERRLEAGGQ